MALFGSSPAPLDKAGLIQVVRKYMEGDDWKYKFDEEKQVIKAGVSLDCKLKRADLYVVFNNNGFTTYGVSPLNADEDSMSEVARYLHGANYGLRNGNFELDYRDGEVRFKVYVNTKGMTSVPDDVLEDALYVPFAMLKKYGNGLAAVAMGFSTAKEALATAEGD